MPGVTRVYGLTGQPKDEKRQRRTTGPHSLLRTKLSVQKPHPCESLPDGSLVPGVAFLESTGKEISPPSLPCFWTETLQDQLTIYWSRSEIGAWDLLRACMEDPYEDTSLTGHKYRRLRQPGSGKEERRRVAYD